MREDSLGGQSAANGTPVMAPEVKFTTCTQSSFTLRLLDWVVVDETVVETQSNHAGDRTQSVAVVSWAEFPLILRVDERHQFPFTPRNRKERTI
jgi:hypothetical protein